MEDTLQYFFPDSDNEKNAKKILKTQGQVVCQNKLSVSWINEHISKFSYGYLYWSPTAQIGRRSIKNNINCKYHLHGFILCRINKNYPHKMWIDIICSRENSKTGQVLLELAEEKARELKTVKLIQLYSLPELKLKNWYKKLGYEVEESSFFDKNEQGKIKPKAYLMQKFI
jgi:hypothetical protein